MLLPRRDLDPDARGQAEDWVGNNAAFTCPHAETSSSSAPLYTETAGTAQPAGGRTPRSPAAPSRAAALGSRAASRSRPLLSHSCFEEHGPYLGKPLGRVFEPGKDDCAFVDGEGKQLHLIGDGTSSRSARSSAPVARTSAASASMASAATGRPASIIGVSGCRLLWRARLRGRPLLLAHIHLWSERGT